MSILTNIHRILTGIRWVYGMIFKVQLTNGRILYELVCDECISELDINFDRLREQALRRYDACSYLPGVLQISVKDYFCELADKKKRKQIFDKYKDIAINLNK